jgi:hypothetical protein
MDSVRVALIGIGSVRCGVPILASLASYFGERPLEVCMYDADSERLDTFDRLARVFFETTDVPHRVLSTEDPFEAMSDSDMLVFSVGRNCLRRLPEVAVPVVSGANSALGEINQGRGSFAPRRRSSEGNLLWRFLADLAPSVPDGAEVLNLLESELPLDRYHRLAWPPKPSMELRAAFPLQALRWINEEEDPFAVIQAYESSPFKQWLNDPYTAELVSRT